MSHQDNLVKVFKDTLDLARKTTSHSYRKSEKWNINEDIPPDEDLLGEIEAEADNGEDGAEGCEVTVVNSDTITTAMDMLDQDLDPLVLNMASDLQPGGGVAKGSTAQEEHLFRCTNYALCTNKSLYPIEDDEVIVTDGVSIIKDQDYQRLPDYVELDFIAVAAVRRPPLEYEDGEPSYMEPEDQQKMQDKIDAIFRYAIYQEKDSLLLGALGCGAFRNPPKVVREMFQSAIDRYRRHFRQITFAVLSNDNNPNYNIFKELQ
jgi:uncharacterized protein (TIGR02452 family)